MNKISLRSLIIILASVLLLSAACGPAPPEAETVADAPASSPLQGPASATATPPAESPEPSPVVEESSQESSSQASPTGASQNVPEPAESCAGEVCTYSGLFLLDRPVGPEGRQAIDHSSRFGIYRKGTEAVRGVYFLNSTGTPVLAAAGGVVVVAGDDSQTPYGRYRGAYGNLVILRHDLPGVSEPLFTLYAHLSQVSVKVEDQVTAGQEIGLVGSSGDISGSSLYFEIRYAENSYQAARNPELWLKPVSEGSDPAQGALAGKIVDSGGDYLQVQNIIIEQLAGPGQPAIDQFYLRTYAGDSLIGLEPWEENFAIGGLPAGEYQISFLMNGMRQQVVEVHPDKVTVVTFQIE